MFGIEIHRCFGCLNIFFDDELVKGNCDECRNKIDTNKKIETHDNINAPIVLPGH